MISRILTIPTAYFKKPIYLIIKNSIFPNNLHTSPKSFINLLSIICKAPITLSYNLT